MYSAIGFSYDSSGSGGPAGAAGAAPVSAAAAAGDDSDSSSDDDSDDDESGDEAALAGQGAGGLAGPVSEAELAQEAEDERIDDMAEAYGLTDFSYRLHRALEKEGEEEARMRKRPK
jgi:arginine/serine-rich splicing factor 16